MPPLCYKLCRRHCRWTDVSFQLFSKHRLDSARRNAERPKPGQAVEGCRFSSVRPEFSPWLNNQSSLWRNCAYIQSGDRVKGTRTPGIMDRVRVSLGAILTQCL